MEPTLNNLLNETINLKKILNNSVNSYYEMLSSLNDTVIEIDRELKSDTRSASELHELRQYKSNLLQMKTDINNQLKETKELLSATSNSIQLYQKVIQLNTGDIF